MGKVNKIRNSKASETKEDSCRAELVFLPYFMYDDTANNFCPERGQKGGENMDAIIKIVGTQNYNLDSADAIELVTDGVYEYSDGEAEIYYSESELTGLEGTSTAIYVTPEEVRMERWGTLTTTMVFREGLRNDFLYETPYGKTIMGLDTRKIFAHFDEEGGNMIIDYVLDMDHALSGRNQFQINVRKRENIV